MITPSCPVLVVHDDGPFRKALVAALDQEHFTVTMAEDGDDAVAALARRSYVVILLGLDANSGKGLRALEQLSVLDGTKIAKVILIGEGSDVHRHAKLVDEVLMKPVDPAYIASRARVYCR